MKRLLIIYSSVPDLPCAWISVPPLCNSPTICGFLCVISANRPLESHHLPRWEGPGSSRIDPLQPNNISFEDRWKTRLPKNKSHFQWSVESSPRCFDFTLLRLGPRHDQSEIEIRANHNSFTRFPALFSDDVHLFCGALIGSLDNLNICYRSVTPVKAKLLYLSCFC